MAFQSNFIPLPTKGEGEPTIAQAVPAMSLSSSMPPPAVTIPKARGKKKRIKFIRNQSLQAAVRESFHNASAESQSHRDRVGDSDLYKEDFLSSVFGRLPRDALANIASMLGDIPVSNRESMTERELCEEQEFLEDQERVRVLKEQEALIAAFEAQSFSDDDAGEPYEFTGSRYSQW